MIEGVEREQNAVGHRAEAEPLLQQVGSARQVRQDHPGSAADGERASHRGWSSGQREGPTQAVAQPRPWPRAAARPHWCRLGKARPDDEPGDQGRHGDHREDPSPRPRRRQHARRRDRPDDRCDGGQRGQLRVVRAQGAAGQQITPDRPRHRDGCRRAQALDQARTHEHGDVPRDGGQEGGGGEGEQSAQGEPTTAPDVGEHPGQQLAESEPDKSGCHAQLHDRVRDLQVSGHVDEARAVRVERQRPRPREHGPDREEPSAARGGASGSPA